MGGSSGAYPSGMTAPDLMGELAEALNKLPGVTSVAQWGGRVWKRPVGGGGGGRGKTKLLAHLYFDGDGKSVTASFKLAPDRARDVCEARDWIEPHSFRTLAPSGWVTATARTRRQVTALVKLLSESYDLYGPLPEAAEPTAAAEPRAAGHIDRVMGQARADGWKPQSDW